MEETNIINFFEQTNENGEIPIPTPVSEDEFKIKYNEIESLCSI